ncbi:MAG: hypothetical protein M1561_03840 [Gammaproteobacteria bacterium]|nr:hypothetical protein [Gammaproteobacteria bacterium]
MANAGDNYAPWSSTYSNLCDLNTEVTKYSGKLPSEIKDSKDLPRALDGALDIITSYLITLEHLSDRLFNQNDAECNEDGDSKDFAPGKGKIREILNTLVGCLHLIIVTFTTQREKISAPSEHYVDMMIGIFSKTQELYLEEDARTKRSDKAKYYKLWEELFHGDRAVAMQKLTERLAESKISDDELPDAKLPESACPNVGAVEHKIDEDAQSEWESLMSRAVVAAENQTQDQERYKLALTQFDSLTNSATSLSDFDSRRKALYETLRVVPIPLMRALNTYRTQLQEYLDFQERKRIRSLAAAAAASTVSDARVVASGSLSKQESIAAPAEHKDLAVSSVQVRPAVSIAAKPKAAPPPIPPRRIEVLRNVLLKTAAEAKAQMMQKFNVSVPRTPAVGSAGAASAVISHSQAAASHVAFFSSSSSLNGGSGGGGAAPAVVANSTASLLASVSGPAGPAASQQHQQQQSLPPRPGAGMTTDSKA